jgi:hypothetical protein
MVSNKASIDKLIWRCHKRNPSHDIKINIREGSIFEGFQIKIPILYFLMYFCFIENISINSALIKCNDFCYQVGEGGITAQSIINFYSVVREKLRAKMHRQWEKDLIGIKINDNLGYSSIEIDESKIISSGQEIYWMFDLIDMNTKEASIRCVLTDRSKNKLLPIIKKYVNTLDGNEYEENEDDENVIMNENVSIKTRIFSGCFRSYHPIDFQNMGFILKRVNHSVWFGAGILHTNTIESLWHQIKLITNNFAGLNINTIKNKFNNNELMITNYIDGWICFSLLIRDFKRLKLKWNDRITYLNNYLICN